ncbi:MAG: hypothetical protein NTZ74_03635 [Chloroflexi bacterium]|nr:hypothetical protein [Chloroflexota bacterium]
MDSQLLTLKAKKIGVILSFNRQKASFSLDILSQLTGISSEELKQIEKGEKCASLPQLEMIAYRLGIPLSGLILGTSPTGNALSINQELIDNLSGIQNRLISLRLKKIRIQKNIPIEKIAEQCLVTVETYEQYELGVTPLPYPVLDCLCTFFGIQPLSLISNDNPLLINKVQTKDKPLTKNTVKLPEELANFIANPDNLPYLELAIRLSRMEATKLRSIAESLLEITY